MYDQREKAQRDYEWALSGAREEGREQGRHKIGSFFPPRPTLCRSGDDW